MRDFIAKKDARLFLFALQNLIKFDYRNFILWTRFINHFSLMMRLSAALSLLNIPLIL